MIVKRTQQGMTLIETMGALAIASMLLLGLTSMIDASLDDVKGKLAAQHQEQAVNAASKYITANYATLVAATAGGTLATVTTAQLKAGNFLPTSFSSTNTFMQASCVLVRQTGSGKLEALVATYGGMPIPDRDVALAAMHAGRGGGYISAAAPGTARGASWALVTTGYRHAACGGAGATVLTGAADDGGHLASSLFFDGRGQLSTDFLHRKALPGRPEHNQMNAPIHMQGANAQAVENDASDPRCTVASGTGKIAVDGAGRVLTCQAGAWRGQGAGYWKDPAATYAALPASGNQAGDVRMVTGLHRAFTWNGAAWIAIAADQNGDLAVPEMAGADLVQLNQIVVKNTPCSDNGTLARDATGLALSCQSGNWRNPLEFRLTNLVYENTWSLKGSPDTQLITLDLATLPGTRPLYMTGFMHCQAVSFMRSYANATMVRHLGVPSYVYSGACMVRVDTPGRAVQNKGFIGLQEIPADATHLQFYLELETGTAAEDFVDIHVKIYNSE